MAFKRTVEERTHSFRDDPQKRERMCEILSDPIFLEALALLRETYLPIAPIMRATADSTALAIALAHSLQAGAHDYEKSLFQLCDEPEKPAEDIPAGRLLNEGEDVPYETRVGRAG